MDPLAVCVYGADKSPAPSRYDTIDQRRPHPMSAVLAQYLILSLNDYDSFGIAVLLGCKRGTVYHHLRDSTLATNSLSGYC